MNREIARICNRVGIERFTAHCFRDTFATSVDVRPKRIFKLNEAAEAHRYLEGQNSFGKVIIRM